MSATREAGPGAVLVADDDAAFCELLVDALVPHGFEVVTAADGVEALLHVTRRRFDAVILDLRMPRLQGIEALKRMRAFDPTVPVLVVTAALEPELEHQSRAAGARVVFFKPLALADLVATLKGQVGGRPSPDAQSAARASIAPATESPPSATRVLVVDDDAEMRDVLREFVASRGYHASTAADGAGALRAIVRQPPDIVLLDIGLPDLSGTDALPAIRAVAPHARVVMVTGEVDRDVAKAALVRGAFDYLVKPVNLAYLADSLDAARRASVLAR